MAEVVITAVTVEGY